MFAGAVKNWLTANGMTRVTVGGFRDYSPAATPAWNVAEAPEGGQEAYQRPLWRTNIQIRARAPDMVRALGAGELAYAAVLAMRSEVLGWTNPADGTARQYRVSGVTPLQRPTHYPTPEAGEEASFNVRCLVEAEAQ